MWTKLRARHSRRKSFALSKDADLDNALQRLENVGHALDAALNKAKRAITSWRSVGAELKDFNECLDALYPEKSDIHRKVFRESAKLMTNLNKDLQPEQLAFGDDIRSMERTVVGYIGEINTLKTEYTKVMEKHRVHAALARKLSKLQKKSNSDLRKIKAITDEASAKHNYLSLLSDTIERMSSSYSKAPEMFKIVFELHWMYHQKILEITGCSFQGLHTAVTESMGYSLTVPSIITRPSAEISETENEHKPIHSLDSSSTFE